MEPRDGLYTQEQKCISYQKRESKFDVSNVQPAAYFFFISTELFRQDPRQQIQESVGQPVQNSKWQVSNTHLEHYTRKNSSTCFYVILYEGVLISSQSDQEGNKLQRPNSGFIQHTPHEAQYTSQPVALTFVSHSKKIQKVVCPTRSPRQQ